MVEDDPDHILVYRCDPNSSSGHCTPQIRKADINKLRKIGDVVARAGRHRLLQRSQGQRALRLRRRGRRHTRSWVRDDAGKWSIFKRQQQDRRRRRSAWASRARRQERRAAGPAQERHRTCVERYDFATARVRRCTRTPPRIRCASCVRWDGKDILGARFQATRPSVEFWTWTIPMRRSCATCTTPSRMREYSCNSASKDGQLIVLNITSDRDPGTFVLFDRKAMKA
jgi:hypothetical protein